MDHRLYFVLGDLGVNIAVGALIGWITCLVVGTDWNMFVAMFALMVVGMLLAGLLSLPIGIFFGAMEVMVPVMLTGMLSGMVIGMAASMQPVASGAGALSGALCGFISIVGVWFTNHALRGEVATNTARATGHD